jgi:phage tail sheath gpL-like
LTAIGDEWFTDFVMPYTDATNLVAMETELSDRFGPLKMLDGTCYICRSDTYANLITAGDGRNSPHIIPMGVYKSPTPPWEWAAAIAGVCAYSSKNDPARPVQTLKLTGILPPAIAHRFILEERDLLLRHGNGTFMVDSGGAVYIERAVTSYRQNPFGAADISYLDLETMKTLAYIRYSLRSYIALRYPRYKLADDGTNFARGQAVVTPKVIRGAIINLFFQWEEMGLVENASQFIEDLIVERDSNDPNRVNALVPPDIINQLRVFAASVQYVL